MARRKTTCSEDISQYLPKKDEFNVLYPSEGFLSVSTLYRLHMEIVRIDPDPANGEAYELKQRNVQTGGSQELFAIAKRGLEKIASAAGIEFDPRYTRRTDDRRNPKRVEFQAMGSIRKPDGSFYSVCRSKEIDLDQIEQELRSELQAMARAGGLRIETGGCRQNLSYGTPECSREISLRLEREMLTRRKNLVAAADSGAFCRVVRSLLNIPLAFSANELRRPFVVPSVSFDLERLLSRKWARQHVLSAGLSTAASLFGRAMGGYRMHAGARPDRSCAEPDGCPQDKDLQAEASLVELRVEDQKKMEILP